MLKALAFGYQGSSPQSLMEEGFLGSWHTILSSGQESFLLGESQNGITPLKSNHTKALKSLPWDHIQGEMACFS